MAERLYCRWKKKLNPSGPDLNGPCQICEGHIMFKGHERCPFLSHFRIYKPLIPFVTEVERQFSLRRRTELGYPIDDEELEGVHKTKKITVKIDDHGRIWYNKMRYYSEMEVQGDHWNEHPEEENEYQPTKEEIEHGDMA